MGKPRTELVSSPFSSQHPGLPAKTHPLIQKNKQTEGRGFSAATFTVHEGVSLPLGAR